MIANACEMEGYERIVMAADRPVCENCGEPWCEKHEEHYSECECLGPTKDGVEYKTVLGVLYGKRVAE